MRHTVILASAALLAALIAIWGATTIANPQKGADAAPAAASIDVMQMMRNARDLPEQRFDAH